MANLSEGDNYKDLAPAISFARGKSPFGCTNMIGNVAEFVAIEDNDSLDPRVLKGGDYYLSSYDSITCFTRRLLSPVIPYPGAGFRCAKDAE